MAIKDMYIRGAPAIGAAAAYGLALAAQQSKAATREALLADLEALTITASEDLAGLRLLVNQEYSIQSQVQDIKQSIQRIGQQRLQDKLREEQERVIAEGKKKISRTLNPKQQITSIAELDALIAELQQLRGELKYAHEFELLIGTSDNDDAQES
jgi:methylthioribose-1-phosphate isomerase